MRFYIPSEWLDPPIPYVLLGVGVFGLLIAGGCLVANEWIYARTTCGIAFLFIGPALMWSNRYYDLGSVLLVVGIIFVIAGFTHAFEDNRHARY